MAGGLIDSPIAHGGPWDSYLDCYRAILEGEIEVLMSNDCYKQNRHLVTLHSDHLQFCQLICFSSLFGLKLSYPQHFLIFLFSKTTVSMSAF